MQTSNQSINGNLVGRSVRTTNDNRKANRKNQCNERARDGWREREEGEMRDTENNATNSHWQHWRNLMMPIVVAFVSCRLLLLLLFIPTRKLIWRIRFDLDFSRIFFAVRNIHNFLLLFQLSHYYSTGTYFATSFLKLNGLAKVMGILSVKAPLLKLSIGYCLLHSSWLTMITYASRMLRRRYRRMTSLHKWTNGFLRCIQGGHWFVLFSVFVLQFLCLLNLARTIQPPLMR